MEKSLLRSTSIVSSMTLFSRLIGFTRDMVIAQMFGAGFALDAFFVAFKIPNFMRRLSAEGAFAQAFVPVLADYSRNRSQAEVRVFISHIAGFLGAVLLLITLFAEMASPLIVTVFAPGFLRDPARFELASHMLRITFPYIFFISLAALSGAILNTYNRFAAPAFMPVFLNLSLIWAAFFLAPQFAEPVVALAWGVFIAGILQLSFQLPFLWRLGMLPLPRIQLRDKGVLKVLRLMIPALFGVSVAQISILIDTLFASFLPVGTVSWLYYSDRLTNMPLGIFGVAIATVVLPHLSKRYAEQSDTAYRATLDWGIRMVLLAGLPSAVALSLLAGPILTTLFNYGEFNTFDVLMAKRSMWAFSVGVPAFMLVKVLVSAFYSRQDIKTPVKVAIIALIVNMILNFVFITRLQHAGLALSTTCAAFVNAGFLWIILYRQTIFVFSPGWLKFILQLLVANTVLAFTLWFASEPLSTWFTWSAGMRAIHLSLIMGTGIISYSLILYLIGFRKQHLRPHAVS